jgi:hypothetical protein
MVLVAAMAGCAGVRGASGHEPAAGSYRYTGSYVPAGESSARTFTGTLHLATVTPERVTGRWEVPGYQEDVQLGTYVDRVYLVNADVVGAATLGTFRHRVRRRDGGTALECTGVFVERVAGTGATRPATCTLERIDGG